TIANEWRMLAIVWHMALGASVVALIAGWRPSNRVVASLPVTPLASVSAVAWAGGNPFNGAMFALLAALLVGIASRISSHPVHMVRPLLFVPAAMLMVFGWTYPHFLERNPWTSYLYAAPMGLLPCPTLATVIGATVILNSLDSTRWTATVAIAGLVYGAIGVLELRVNLDYGLLAGALMALGGLAQRGPIGAGRTVHDWNKRHPLSSYFWTTLAPRSTASRSVRATREEKTRAFPGDDQIPQAIDTLTHGVTIRCTPRDVWPWLVQMGAGTRAGWYSYDWLDNPRQPSATRVVPEPQHPAIGSVFPALPGVTEGFTLLAIEPERMLMLGWPAPNGTVEVTWTFVLEEVPHGGTRLLVRVRGGPGYRFHGLPLLLTRLVVRVVHLIMQRKQLVEIARRAEKIMCHSSAFKTREGGGAYIAAYDAAMRLWPVRFEETEIATRFGRTHVVMAGPAGVYAPVLPHGDMAAAGRGAPRM